MTVNGPARTWLIFLKDIDKMAILGLHISKILHEKTFGRKNANFERGLQMVDYQWLGLILVKIGVR